MSKKPSHALVLKDTRIKELEAINEWQTFQIKQLQHEIEQLQHVPEGSLTVETIQNREWHKTMGFVEQYFIPFYHAWHEIQNIQNRIYGAITDSSGEGTRKVIDYLIPELTGALGDVHLKLSTIEGEIGAQPEYRSQCAPGFEQTEEAIIAAALFVNGEDKRGAKLQKIAIQNEKHRDIFDIRANFKPGPDKKGQAKKRQMLAVSYMTLRAAGVKQPEAAAQVYDEFKRLAVIYGPDSVYADAFALLKETPELENYLSGLASQYRKEQEERGRFGS